MDYNIVKSDWITNVEDITWSSLTANLPHYNNFKEEHVLDYDKNTYSSASALNTQNEIALEYNITNGTSLFVDYLYINWRNLDNASYIKLYVSDDLNIWNAAEFETCYGDASIDSPGRLRLDKPIEGKLIAKLIDAAKKKYYRIIFESATNFDSGDFLSVYSAWMGNNLELIQPNIDKTNEVYIENYNKVKNFDGSYNTSIFGSHSRNRWDVKWEYITKNELNNVIDFINNLIYNPKLCFWDIENTNEIIYECIFLEESVVVEEIDDYLYSVSIRIQEI